MENKLPPGVEIVGQTFRVTDFIVYSEHFRKQGKKLPMIKIRDNLGTTFDEWHTENKIRPAGLSISIARMAWNHQQERIDLLEEEVRQLERKCSNLIDSFDDLSERYLRKVYDPIG